MDFTPQIHPFLDNRIYVNMCHYPMVSWSRKSYGAIMLHGHCHGKIDTSNNESGELRFDVGVDGELAKRCSGIVDLESIYQIAMEKTGGLRFAEYVANCYKKNLLRFNYQ